MESILKELYEEFEEKEDYKILIENLRRKRGAFRGKTTFILNTLSDFKNENKLTKSSVKDLIAKVEKNETQIEAYNLAIITIMQRTKDLEEETPYYKKELDSQSAYEVQVALRISEFNEFVENCDTNRASSANQNAQQKVVSQINLNEAKLPPIECPSFTGMEKDKNFFNTFLKKFEDLVGNRTNLSDTAKQIYLLGYLKDYAYTVVSHLSIAEGNYRTAVELLKKEFLDIPFIVDDTLKNIIKATPNDNERDENFTAVKTYINEIKTYLYELKNNNIDFITEGSSGNLLISHIVFNNLPTIIKRGLINKLSVNYPSINQIFDNYLDIIKVLNTTKPDYKFKSNKKSEVKPKENKGVNNKLTNKSNERNIIKGHTPHKSNIPSVKNFKTDNRQVYCKLCLTDSHSMGSCTQFPNYKSKIARLIELGLCEKCAGPNHKTEQCYGQQNKLRFACKLCGTKEHITSLCPKSNENTKSNNTINTTTNLCLAQRTIDSNNILPTMSLYLKWGNKWQRVRCLLDTGSQRSYASADVVKNLCNVEDFFTLECDIKTYNGLESKTFKQIALGVEVDPNKRIIPVPILIDENLDIEIEIPGMNYVVNAFEKSKFRLLDSFYNSKVNNEKVKIDMLVGVDIIQYLPSFNIKKELNGSCLEVGKKLAPIGNILNFLNNKQTIELTKTLTDRKRYEEQTKTSVNLVMDPIKSYFNPLDHILQDSEVDNGLEYLFSLESMGIKTDNKELINYDEEKVQRFKQGITFENGHYHVELPWHEDKINLVPSNHNVALKVLDRTMINLKKNNLVKEYENVFDQQLDADIIEEIQVPNHDLNKYIWIPHRPVIKMDEQVTTKIRPVFNCSLKTKNEVPSLNEAAYTGIDMMGSILNLLLQFRTNNLTMLSDIRQAFLMIKLKKEEDKNRFCFFWKKGDKLIKYRYKTIVFGFTASPFILNYVMQHHMNRVLDEKNKQNLANNFYVDNLFITGNDLTEMKKLYKLSNEKLQEGGFELRSWNTNSIELRRDMIADDKLSVHSSKEEKVLGYKYNTEEDTLKIASIKMNENLNTKRKVLSQITKVYDPLNFALPVTIRGRIIMRKIWKQNLNWDDQLPEEICKEVEKIVKDTEMITEVSYPRQALNERDTYALHIFCDSSAEAYGFVAYAVNKKGQSSYIFSKSKLTPIKGKEHSIPTLELLGVALAVKCLPSLLEAYKKFQFEYINLAVDAQVVLNWLLNKPTNVKTRFIKNRLVEIDEAVKLIKDQSGLPIHYHYVKSEHNPADMITKGLNYLSYIKQLNFWLKGPEWLSNNFDTWPKYPLLSISPEHKERINNTLTLQPTKVNTGILNINKYSTYDDLIRNTGYLFRFKSKVKGGDERKMAKEYWIKIIQRECFHKEIEFLETTTTSKDERLIPPLVMNLNLFLDDKGILRSRGRISKCLYYTYDVHNPVLLPKTHRFTYLFINHCHKKVQHLGIGTTLNYLREQGYWIPKGRAAVKSTLSDCITCRKFNNLAYKYPKFANMPKHHLNLVKPFEHVGVDYTGHLWVRDETGKSIKMFILIFTCLNIRAVHFELVPDMSSHNFLLAFQRFTNLYSIPKFIYSDNAKTFLKGGSILEQSLTSNEFQEELKKNDIRHIKIPLYSAWIGSAWERLIRVLKSCLYKVVGRSQLSYYELITTLSNIKLAINSRPLTYRSSTDELEFITPNSFLKLFGNSSLILRTDDVEVWTEDPTQNQLENSLDKQNEILENFKSLWYESYLLSLREHSRNLYQQNWENKVKVGDIVLIKAVNKPRPFWMMGKILELIMGHDNKVRTVKLKQGNGSIEYHSIKNLYPLELNATHQFDENRVDNSDVAGARDEVQAVDSIETSRPKRKATERFRRIMKEQLGNI